MHLIRSTSAAILAAGLSCAQTVNVPPAEISQASVRALRRSSKVSEEMKARADKLLAESATDGRRSLANAYVLLKGGTWDGKQDYIWSLALRPDTVIADSSLPLVARLTQSYPAFYKPTGAMKVKLALLTPDGKPFRSLGAFDLTARDLVDQPFGLDADLGGVADGGYVASAEITDGETSLVSVTSPLWVVKGIATGRAAIDKRLAAIRGHEDTKASIRYPYVLAETVNAGRRQFSEADFGLPDKPQPPYDFVRGVKTSAELLRALEAGRDPLLRAKGEHERHYWFEDAREMMAYHLYVPVKWDGRAKLPMVLVLHGNTRDQDYYFDRDERMLAKLAEQHGYLVVCPMGYRPNAGWGAAGGGRGGAPPDPARVRQTELSEKDALTVLDRVTKEYPVDPARIFLFGHSAGGTGTWHMGQKYADKWAAIAASAAATRPDNYPFDRLKGIPIMLCHGDQDDQVPVASSRNMFKTAKEKGLDARYMEVPGATHLTIVSLAEPKVFDFFDQVGRKK